MNVKYLLTLLFLTLTNGLVFSQHLKQNNRYISSLTVPARYDVDIWSMAQNSNKEMFFATRQGILMYNGLSWQLIKTNNIPLVLKLSQQSGTMYVGSHSDFGMLERNDSLGYVYKSLAKNKNINTPVSEIITLNGDIIFYSATNAFMLNEQNKEAVTILKLMDNSYFKGTIILNNQVYFLNEKNNLFVLKNKMLQQTTHNFDQTRNHQILFSIPNGKQALVGLSDNKIYNFNGKSLTQLKTNVDKFIEKSALQNAININQTLFAVSTIAGGVLVLNKDSGQLQFALNYNTGLPDDEIYSMFLDANHGFWLTHQFGISRIDFKSPISDYTHYPGLEGRIIAVSVLDSVPYLATTAGLYYLKEITSIKEVQRMVKKQQQQPDEIKENKNEQRFFKRLFGGRKAQKEQTTDLADLMKKSEQEADSFTIIKEQIPQEEPKFQSSQELLELLPLTYAYAPVEGLSVKTRQLIPFENQMIAATNQGLFVVENNKASEILSDLYINHIVLQPTLKLLFVATHNGIIVLKKHNKKWKPDYRFSRFGPVYSMALQNDSTLWAGIEGMTFYLKFSPQEYQPQRIPERFDVPVPEKVFVRNINGTVYFMLNNNVYFLKDKKILPTDHINGENIRDVQLLKATNDHLWIIEPYKKNISNNAVMENQLKYLNLFESYQDLFFDANQNLWLTTKQDQLLCIKKQAKNLKPDSFSIFVSRITTQNGKILNQGNISLTHDNNILFIELSAPYFAKNNAIEYQYFISGVSRSWSSWQHDSQINIEMLPAGKYKLLIRARNILGQQFESELIDFSVLPPWWKKTQSIIAFILLGIGIIAFVVYSVMKNKQAKLEREKQVLEERVRERTQELAAKNKEITDSINYASNIQTAVLPPLTVLSNKVSDFFILNKPRDIVSGDFYWMTQINDKTIVVAADCTGHGVPGAFMSMLGVSFLNEIVKQKGVSDAAEILNRLRSSVIQALRQNEEGSVQKDGMDVAMVSIDSKNMSMQFAGAYNSLFLISDNQLIETKADKMPIGIHRKYQTPFSAKTIDIKKGDVIYLFSDGFVDQFGGPKGKKYLKNRFKETLLQIHRLPANEQKDFLQKEYEQWKGQAPQIDDVLVIGLIV